MDNNKWLKLDIFTSQSGAEIVCAALGTLGITGFQITDPNDLDDFLNRALGYWDYYDESILSLRDAETTVTAYIAESNQSSDIAVSVRQELNRLKSADTHGEWGRLECDVSGVSEDDWAYAWKKYYHALKIGEKLVVCPSWEEYERSDNDVVLRLDPGMAFGTGTHETTRLCMCLIEKHMPENARVLDLGSGSGILSIAAALLGAETVCGVDIDETAVRVAKENAALNGVSGKCKFSKAAIEAVLETGFDLVLVNIVADVILANLVHIVRRAKEPGVIILSGIIDDRENDVIRAAGDAGLEVLELERENGWVAMALRRYSSTRSSARDGVSVCINVSTP